MEHEKSIALMKFLSGFAKQHPLVGRNTYVVGGSVRNFLLGRAIKDLDLTIDTIALGGKDASWFAESLSESLQRGGVRVPYTFNQYGVAILTVRSSWVLDGWEMKGVVIEIANCRKESYSGAGGKGKGYKPTDVSPATIEEDVYRREFTFNTLLWRLGDLAEGPKDAEILDLTGRGRADLEAKTIQTPQSPDQTFSDDPTRMLRAIRFLLRYGFVLAPEVEDSIVRNAPKMKNMPWEAVATILLRGILDNPGARSALRTLEAYGLLAVIREMVEEQKPFAAYLAGQFGTGDWDVDLLLDLAETGLSRKAVEFLSPEQRVRLREILTHLTPREGVTFFATLRRPPVPSEPLIEEFALQGRDRGRIVAIAREALLASPSLSTDALLSEVRNGLQRATSAD